MLLINKDVDLPSGREDKANISQMSPTTDGFITCGAYNNAIFDSKYGIALSLQNKQGGYVTKHDKNGVLKWVVYTTANYNGTENKSNFTSCIEDLEGNIYISGFSNGNFHDNSGKVISLGYAIAPSYANLNDFIIKLNSKGELIWRVQTSNTGFAKLSIDKENNVVVNTQFPYSPTVSIFLNGFFVKDLNYNYPSSDNYYDQRDVRGLMKIAPNGTVLWNTKFISDNVNGYSSNIIGFDKLNNIYVSSSCETGVDFYSVNNSVKSVLGGGTYGGKFAIAKYDSGGNCLWAIRSRTISNIPDNTDSTNIKGYAVDDAGNCYISGVNKCIPYTSQYTHVFENADGSVTKTTKGTYFIAKVNTNGVCEWIRSTSQNVSGKASLLHRYSDELFVLGYMDSDTSAEFQSSNNINYTLAINEYNYFIAVYDLNGNLKRMFTNTDFNNKIPGIGFVSFFKDNEDSFYLARNMSSYENGYVDFGNTITALNGSDGVIVKFKESCGVSKYLGINENSFDNLNLLLYPNPTSNEFKIDLKEEYQEISLEIYDIYGKIIKKEMYYDKKEIVSKIDTASGIYIIKLKYQDKVQWLKMIKR